MDDVTNYKFGGNHDENFTRRVNCPVMPGPTDDAARMTRRLTAVGAVISSLIGASAMGQQAPASTAPIPRS